MNEDEDLIYDQTLLLRKETKPSGYSRWCHKFTKTICLSLAFFTLGLCIAIPGPTLLDLGEKVNADTTHMVLIFSARSVGYLLGALIGGFLFDIFDKQLLLTATLFVAAVATMIIPWSLTLTVLAVMFSLQGVSMGVLDTGGNVFCMRLWGGKSPPYMQALHFAFGIGAFIAPLIAQPFLSTTNSTNIVLQGNVPIINSNVIDSALFSNQSYERTRRDTDPIKLNDTLGDILGSTNNATNQFSTTTLNMTTSTLTTSTTTTTVLPLPKKPGIVDGNKIPNSHPDGENLKNLVKINKVVDQQPPDDKDTHEQTNKIEEDKDSSKRQGPEKVGVTSNLTSSENITSSVESENGTSSNSSSSVILSPSTTKAESTQKAGLTPSPATTKNISTTAKTVVTTMIPSTTTTPSITTIIRTTAKTTPITTTTTPSTTTTTPTTTTTTPTTTTTTQPTTIKPTTKKPVSITTLPAKIETPKSGEIAKPKESLIPTVTSIEEHTSSNLSEISTIPVSTTTVHKPKSSVGDLLNNVINSVKNMSRIQFAYSIIGLLLFLSSTLFLVSYCFSKCRRDGGEIEEIDRMSVHNENTCARVITLVFSFFFFLCYVGMETTFGGLIMTFAVEFAHWTKSQGAIVTAIFWGSLAVGRGFAIFISNCCKPRTMLIIDLIFTMIGTLILAFGVQHLNILLWLGTVFLGIGLSSIFPTSVTWVEQYFQITGKSTAVFVTGSAIGQMILPVVTGYLYQTFNKQYLMYMVLLMSVFTVILYIIMQCLASKVGTMKTSNGFLRLDDLDTEMDSAMYNSTQDSERRKFKPVHNGYDLLLQDAEEEEF